MNKPMNMKIQVREEGAHFYCRLPLPESAVRRKMRAPVDPRKVLGNSNSCNR
jgi:hypothetical protein